MGNRLAGLEMSKKFIGVFVGALLVVGALTITGCSTSSTKQETTSNPTGNISVYSREEGSGTRGAFIELFGVEEKDSSGNKVDKTVTSATITNSTSVVMTSVAGDKNGIGYISLGSLNDTVKALQIDGVAATAENVKNGTYKIARPFNIVTKSTASDVSKDFIAFIMSSDGQKIVSSNGYITVDDAAKAYAASGKTGKIVIAGSSSVTPVMEKLAEAYKKLNTGVTIEVQQSDSTTGMNMAIAGTCDIGMASREVKDSEKASGLTPIVIAKDGIAIIINKGSAVSGLTSAQIKAIYTGSITTWEKALA